CGILLGDLILTRNEENKMPDAFYYTALLGWFI
ncbi:MAG: hypothetical protein ACI917_001137, partial [Patiriisocius sp.]